MKLSKNFSLEELTRSQYATRWGIDNTPGEEELENLEILVRSYLQPFRDWTGEPVIISSGYRCPELNRIIGGSDTSAHMAGLAADMVPYRPSQSASDLWLLWEEFLELPGSPEFDQLINEYGEWVHLSVAAYYRNQYKTFKRKPEDG